MAHFKGKEVLGESFSTGRDYAEALCRVLLDLPRSHWDRPRHRWRLREMAKVRRADTVLIDRDWLTLSIRYYTEGDVWGIRRLAWPTLDRWALDFFSTSLIIELWCLRNWSLK